MAKPGPWPAAANRGRCPTFKRADAAAADPGSSVGIAAADLVRREGNCWDFVHQQLSNQLLEVKSLWGSRSKTRGAATPRTEKKIGGGSGGGAVGVGGASDRGR